MKDGQYRKHLGKEGEIEAVEYLLKKGYMIFERNYRAERGEIDIVVGDGETLVFVEVKTKRRNGFGGPEGWVDVKKQNQIGKVAMRYLQDRDLNDVDCRFDVVVVSYDHGKKKIKHIKNAFWLEAHD
ncbi:YraN family protein [bacterium]|nr:YraN family protein [bacterium]